MVGKKIIYLEHPMAALRVHQTVLKLERYWELPRQRGLERWKVLQRALLNKTKSKR